MKPEVEVVIDPQDDKGYLIKVTPPLHLWRYSSFYSQEQLVAKLDEELAVFVNTKTEPKYIKARVQFLLLAALVEKLVAVPAMYCKHCHIPQEQHSDGKCLFEPTYFEF